MGTLTAAQVYQYAVGAGFTPAQATVMTAIAGAESGYNPNAYNGTPPDNSYGLWQINMIGSLGPARRSQLGLASNNALFDPATNARAAKAVFDSQGFGAWSTYSSGSYQRYLSGAQTASSSASGGSSSSGPAPTFGPGWAPWNWPSDLINAGAGAAQSAANSTAQQVLGGVGNILMRGVFIVLGVGLIGVGVTRGLTGGVRRQVDQVVDQLPPVVPV
jgi:hypothetical protein